MKKLKVGIIGCGTIGTALAQFLIKKERSRARLAFLCDRVPEKAKKLQTALPKNISITSISELIRKSDLVIETASVAVSGKVARDALRQHKQVLILSVGGLIKETGWLRAAQKTRGRLWIPSGALDGIDGLLAAREGRIRRVLLRTQKPPASLRHAAYFTRHAFPKMRAKKDYCLFKGSALEAVKGFPQNVNVAAIASLAGIGPRKTRVEIWTAPHFPWNQHELVVEGDFGILRTQVRNLPSPLNPKTSTLAILSSIAMLRKIFSSLQIGT